MGYHAVMSIKPPQSPIQVIDRMAALIRAVAAHDKGVSLKHLSAETVLHPSTAYRILAALQVHGFVERNVAGEYRLGSAWLSLGARMTTQRDLREEAKPFLDALRDQVGETVNLTVREGDQVVYVERALPNRMMRVEQVVGSRAPLHVTAVGKLMLGESGEQACRDYAERSGLPRYTVNTITDAQQLVNEALAAVRRGFAYDDEEAEVGVGCIGVLLRDGTGAAVAGLSISAPRERRQEAWAGLLRQTADKISARMGFVSEHTDMPEWRDLPA